MQAALINKTTTIESEVAVAANKILDWLAENVQPEWAIVLNYAFDGKHEAQIDRVYEAKDELEVEFCVGAIAQGTGYIREKAGVFGEVGAKAIMELKQHHRIVQCGSGRGKVIVLVSKEHLPYDIVKAIPINDTIPAQVQAELDAINERLNSMQKRLDEMAVSTWR